MDLEEIELKYNLDFEPNIKKNYANIILDIFNNPIDVIRHPHFINSIKLV